MSAEPMRAGVIGHPISHSLSPRVHRAWIAARGIDAAYDAFDVASADLKDFVERHRGGATLRGVNVTIPHKEDALALSDIANEAASCAGAANVLLFRPDGVVEARNTDGVGLLEAFRIKTPAFDPKTCRVLILGASGAARGAVAAFVAEGNTHVVIANRTDEKALALAQAFGVDSRPWANLQMPSGTEVVINATSMGLGDTSSPRLQWPSPSGPGVALDMVYGAPGFLADARRAGWRTVDGLEMLIGQAAPSFEAFFGVQPPENYRTLALAALETPL
ncbi:MAG TPA: shikimate dehydrogenase [Caulobacteraceae bacterium]|nr:shikimate dehydrogenase [Caulobacteraceae bacterium]